MGSLMSGWDSPVLRSKSGTYKRNSSLTKEEINAYWKSKQKTAEEHVKEISTLSDSKNLKVSDVEAFTFKRSTSLPLQNTLRSNNKKVGLDEDDKTMDKDKLVKKNGWWTRSNWAFLNEPPVIESTSNRYVTQFHVAALAPSKSHAGNGIATI